MTPIDNDKIIEVMAKAIETRVGQNDRNGKKLTTYQETALAALTALSSSGYIICQASDAETGEAVSRKSALQFGVAGKLLMIAAKISTQTQFGWSHPDCETLEEAARILRGGPPPQTDDDRAEGVLSQRQLEEAQADTATTEQTPLA